MSKFLSLEWFKGTAERTIEKVIASKLESLMEQDVPVGSDYDVDKQLYKNLKLVNDTLTVVMANGDIFSKPGATEQDYFAVSLAETEMDILKVVMTPEVADQRIAADAELKRKQALLKGIKLLEDLDDFIIEDNVVYLTGTSRSLPQLLVEKFIEIVNRVGQQFADDRTFDEALNQDEEYLAHKRFFMWCCLNPRAEVANELYRFLTDNSFKITKQGFFVALRNVVTLHGSPELVHFVSNAYNKVKAVWKKNPDKYTVFLQPDGEYKLVHEDDLTKTETRTSTTCPDCLGDGGWECIDDTEDNDWFDCPECDGTGEVEEYTYDEVWSVDHGQKIGVLTELYLDLPNREENRFTDDWTKTFDIRIGRTVSMPMNDCNWSTQDCAAAGLHFTADQIHYVGCGDQSVLVLINPMKVVGIGQHKGRCYEYLPIMTVPREEATSILHDLSFDTLELDESYAVRELEGLEDKVQEGFIYEASKHEFNLPEISSWSIKCIVNSLESMKFEISKRIVTID
jgi:hypothetical protein